MIYYVVYFKLKIFPPQDAAALPHLSDNVPAIPAAPQPHALFSVAGMDVLGEVGCPKCTPKTGENYILDCYYLLFGIRLSFIIFPSCRNYKFIRGTEMH